MSEPTASVPLAQSSAGDLCKIYIHTNISTGFTRDEPSVEMFLRDDYALRSPKDGFHWIHIPVNNMTWVEVRTMEGDGVTGS